MASLPPHVYAVADAAIRIMTGPLAATQGCSDQSILVSGESGAVKTESSKFIMNHLAVVATQQQHAMVEEEGGIASQVLQTNPILESFLECPHNSQHKLFTLRQVYRAAFH